MNHKIGVGTVQFGLNYGISNKAGQPLEEEVEKILLQAEISGCSIIDTASEYGNAEELLGRLLPDRHHFKIVTKLQSLGGKDISNKLINNYEFNFYRSLRNMNQSKIYALLAHNADDLLKKNGEKFYELMLSMRENGVIEKIGVSIYNKPQLDKLLNRYDFDIVQAPINVLDQRLIKDGTLEFLYGKGIEVHARSSFLQGLLLMPLNKVPNYFSPILKNLIIWNNRLSDNGISLVEGALSYVCSLHQVKSVIVGVNSLMELEQCIKYGSSNVHINTSDIYCDDVNMIDPRLWTS